MAAPKGQLPPTSLAELVANRIKDLDQSGEDCRQRLGNVREKIHTYNRVAAEKNASSQK